MSQVKFRKNQSAAIRIWHWVDALLILGLLLTVLIRKTFLSWRTNAKVIEEMMLENGTPVSFEFARKVAVTIRDPLWDWHIYFGYALGIFFLFRIVIAFVNRGEEKERNLRNLFRARNLHVFGAYLLYRIFYVMTAFMVISGVILAFKEQLGWEKSTFSSIKEVHELSMWFFVGFVVLHIGGVVLTELKDEPGLVSDMISGGKKK
jgi:Ni,Fe-hydrogenase I cytochrome b subunit